jgi:hypothetical protein
MQIDSFTGYLKAPQTLNNDSIGELSELLDHYPYCETTRILYTLNLLKEKHIRYEDELKTTAVYVGDRRVLKKHIDQLSSKPQPVVLPDEHIEIKEEPLPESVFSEGTETEEVTIETGNIRDDEVKVQTIPQDEAEKEFVEEDIKIEALPETKSEQIDEVVEEDHLVIPEPVIPTYSIEKEFPDKEEDALSQLKKIVSERIRQIEKEKSVDDKIHLEQVSEEKSDPGKSASELIDDFIRHEPSISRPKTPFFNPADAAKESIIDEQNIVSETLARIYYDQRKFGKAIEVYKKLSLKYPGKSSYFAALIEKAIEELKK